jgi:hypothetical protein
MTPSDKPGDATLVSCEVCLKEIPKSEASVPEAVNYFVYFCGPTAIRSGTTTGRHASGANDSGRGGCHRERSYSRSRSDVRGTTGIQVIRSSVFSKGRRWSTRSKASRR